MGPDQFTFPTLPLVVCNAPWGSTHPVTPVYFAVPHILNTAEGLGQQALATGVPASAIRPTMPTEHRALIDSIESLGVSGRLNQAQAAYQSALDKLPKHARAIMLHETFRATTVDLAYAAVLGHPLALFKLAELEQNHPDLARVSPENSVRQVLHILRNTRSRWTSECVLAHIVACAGQRSEKIGNLRTQLIDILRHKKDRQHDGADQIYQGVAPTPSLLHATSQRGNQSQDDEVQLAAHTLCQFRPRLM